MMPRKAAPALSPGPIAASCPQQLQQQHTLKVTFILSVGAAYGCSITATAAVYGLMVVGWGWVASRKLCRDVAWGGMMLWFAAKAGGRNK